MQKRTIKNLIKQLFSLLLLPVCLLYWLLTLFANEDAVFQNFCQFLSLIPGKVGVYSRAAFLNLICPNTANTISVSFSTLFSHRDCEIHDGVYIGPQSNIGKCRINKNCLIGSAVHVISGKKQHGFSDLESPIKDQKGQYEKIVIGEDCWIGNGAIVMANVGKKCIVAAGAVVVDDIEDYSIVAGNPAKLIKKRK